MRKGVGEERCGRDEEERERERSTRQDGLDGVYLLSGHREYITSSTVVPLPHNNLYGLALYQLFIKRFMLKYIVVVYILVLPRNNIMYMNTYTGCYIANGALQLHPYPVLVLINSQHFSKQGCSVVVQFK